METNVITKSITPGIVLDALAKADIGKTAEVICKMVTEIQANKLRSKEQLVDILTKYVGNNATVVTNNIFDLLKTKHQDDYELMSELQTFILNSDQLSDLQKIELINKQRKSADMRDFLHSLVGFGMDIAIRVLCGYEVKQIIGTIYNRHSTPNFNYNKPVTVKQSFPVDYAKALTNLNLAEKRGIFNNL